MDWVGVVIVLGLILLVGGVIWKVIHDPQFWIRLATDLGKLAGPIVWEYLSRQEDPETRKRRQEVQRRGGEWDFFRKRERRR